MAEAHLRWQADTAEAIAKTEALKRVVASVGGTSTTNAIKSIGSAWKIVIPAVVGAGVAILGLTGNMAALAPLIPVVTALLTGFLAPFTTLAAMVVGFIPPLTLLVGLLGGLAVAFGLAGKRALAGGGQFSGFAKQIAELGKQFKGLTTALAHDFLPIFVMLAHSASTALGYLTKIAHLPLKQAFQSLSTTGVEGFQKFLDKIGHIIAKPIRLAFQVAFGKSDALRKALVDDWNDIVNFFVGHKGVLLPVQKWFGKQDFTAVGYRWANELAGATMRALGAAFLKLLSSQGGKFILGGAGIGAGIGLSIGGPLGAAIGAAIGVAIGVALNHYWPRITATASRAVRAIQGFLKRALGPQLWGQIISQAQSFWSTLRQVGGFIANVIWPAVKRVWSALGGWHTVGVIVAGEIRVIAGILVTAGKVVQSIWGAFQGMVGTIQSIIGALQTAVGVATSLANAVGSGLGGSPGSGGQGGVPSTGKGHVGVHKSVGATGGIVTRPTMSLIGEAGPEAVIPLNKMPGAFPLGTRSLVGGSYSSRRNSMVVSFTDAEASRLQRATSRRSVRRG